MVNEQLVFPPNSAANNQCIEVTLVQDAAVEGIEFFSIIANSNNGDTARVFIIIVDNDGRWWNYTAHASLDSTAWNVTILAECAFIYTQGHNAMELVWRSVLLGLQVHPYPETL